jgi:hypothetical protein
MKWPQGTVCVDPTATVDLSRFNDEYRRTKTEDAPPASHPSQTRFGVPDGQYRVNVDSVELTTAKSSGNPMLKWKLRVLAGPYEHRWLFKNRVITPATLEWVKKEMAVCGLELEPFSDLPHRLAELVNTELLVAKLTRGEYENIYLNKKVTPPNEGEIAELADDLPF